MIPSLLAIGLPLAMLVLPGIAFLGYWRHETPLVMWAYIFITSIVTTILVTLLAALVGVPVVVAPILLSMATLALLFWQRSALQQIKRWYSVVRPAVLFVGIVLIFTIPAVVLHDGLPTGDIQKSILWAEEIVRERHLPQYGRAIADYNRDPVDFYTPGLHTLLAYTQAPVIAASTFSIVMAVAGAFIGAAVAQRLLPALSPWLLSSTTAFLILTNLRWLRYLREPGYHVQNSVGEVLLFGIVFVVVGLLRKWTWPNVVLVAGGLLALAFTHQFSAFVGGFALVPWAAVILVQYIRTHRSWKSLSILLAPILIIGVVSVVLGLHRKIAHVFSAAPHLISLVPTWSDYFSLMGPGWLAVGLAGGLILAWYTYRQRDLGIAAFVGMTAIVLLLSQAPRFYLDIPPVRALFYSVIPLSISGAYAVGHLFQQRHYLLASMLLLVVLSSSADSVGRAYTLSHTIRTNSTLLPSQQHLIERLRREQSLGGVVIDDYNRRSASWLILAHQPTYSRIAADLAVQMAEARQSSVRYQLYLNQLDFEKIFLLGSHPAGAEVMRKHAVRFVTGIANSSDAFAHNPALVSDATGGDITLYKLRENFTSQTSTHDSLPINWLLRPTTMVNDIGDNEDTFLHLPASLRTTRLSEPLRAGATTFRTTNAKNIPLYFNVGDFVHTLWNQQYTEHPDISVELHIAWATPPLSPLRVRTSTGTTYAVPTNGSSLVIPAAEARYDEKGFVPLVLENPSGQLVSLDLIALGLAQVP